MDRGVRHRPAIPFFRLLANPRSSKATAQPRAVWSRQMHQMVTILGFQEDKGTGALGSANIHVADGRHLRATKGQDHQQILRVSNLADKSNGPSTLEKVDSVRSLSPMSCDPSALSPFPEIVSGSIVGGTAVLP